MFCEFCAFLSLSLFSKCPRHRLQLRDGYTISRLSIIINIPRIDQCLLRIYDFERS